MVKTKYVCSDGAVFDDEEEAMLHEEANTLAHPLFKLISDSNAFYAAGECNLEDEAFNFIKDNWEEIKQAMREPGPESCEHRWGSVAVPCPEGRLNCVHTENRCEKCGKPYNG